MPERDVMKGCLEALAIFGVDCRRQNTGAFTNPAGRVVRCGEGGDPDITGVLGDGRRLDLEVKRPGRRPTAKQLDRLMRTNAAGGVGLWVDSAAELARLIPMLLAGCRVEVEPDGDQWITDEEPKR